MNIIQWVCNEFVISERDLTSFIKSSPYRYKKYDIPKKNGKGTRRIAQPAKQVKNLQRIIYENFFLDMPIHDAATAYRKNRNIKWNVTPHVANSYHVKMDFKDFFPSLKPDDFIAHVESVRGESLLESDKLVITRLFFYSPKRGAPLVLSIGAPTSPTISNTLLYEFDKKVSRYCLENSISYTRYADDITFSTNKRNVLYDIPKVVDATLKQLSYPKLTINVDKTVFTSKRLNRHITGLVVTNDGLISIGRDNKRKVKALIHRCACNNINDDDLSYLKGYLSFCQDVEPDFITALIKKYGLDLIEKIKK